MNIKVIIFAVVAFVVGVGGGTGVVVMRAPNAPPSDSLTATATAHGKAHADSGTRAHSTTATAATTHASHDAHPSVASPAPSHAAPAPSKAQKPGAGDASAEPAEDYAQVAKIFTNMKPADAAKLFVYLPDTQAEGILRTMGARQAATLLTEMPSDRAARLSQRLLRPIAAKVQ